MNTNTTIEIIKELEKEIVFNNKGQCISCPNFINVLKQARRDEVENIWHILHPRDKSFDGLTKKEYDDLNIKNIIENKKLDKLYKFYSRKDKQDIELIKEQFRFLMANRPEKGVTIAL